MVRCTHVGEKRHVLTQTKQPNCIQVKKELVHVKKCSRKYSILYGKILDILNVIVQSIEIIDIYYFYVSNTSRKISFDFKKNTKRVENTRRSRSFNKLRNRTEEVLLSSV